MEEKVLLEATLVFPVTDTHVLLARKMKKIGRGCWNGYGGGIEPGEAPSATALREFAEESGGMVGKPADLRKVAVVDFHNQKHDGERFVTRVYVFLLTTWEGQATTTPEMADPQWYPIASLPLDELMLSDRDWLPRILAGEMLYAEAWYGSEQKTVEQPTQVRRISPDELNRL